MTTTSTTHWRVSTITIEHDGDDIAIRIQTADGTHDVYCLTPDNGPPIHVRVEDQPADCCEHCYKPGGKIAKYGALWHPGCLEQFEIEYNAHLDMFKAEDEIPW